MSLRLLGKRLITECLKDGGSSLTHSDWILASTVPVMSLGTEYEDVMSIGYLRLVDFI